MATDSAFWRDLEAQFRALPDPERKLTAVLNEGQWHVDVVDDPRDRRQKERLRALFLSLARIAAAAAGVAGRANPPDGWLNLLRDESPDFHPCGTSCPNGVETPEEGGWIRNLPLASAEYCIELKARAFELETAASSRGPQAQAASGGAEAQPVLKKKRGRPQTIPDERKAAALKCKDGGGTLRAAAVIIYSTSYPTPQQVKNVSTLLRIYRAKLEKARSPGPKHLSPSRKTNKIKG